MTYCATCGAANAIGSDDCFACQRSLGETSAASRHEESLIRGRYRKLAQVGTGGFGAVYKATDCQDNDRIVALKEINLHGLKPQEIIDATDTFNREVEVLSPLRHSGLPHIYEHFTDTDHWYLIMDFIEGQTLETYLLDNGGHLPLNEVLHIGIQLCLVLEYLHIHQPTIIFRDLKPANVMLTPSQQVYLIDFGTARFFKPGKLRDTIAFGSPGYAAPEQYGKAQTTPRSDIYSLGATLHTMLTGDDPSESPFRFASLHRTGQTIPDELEQLLTRMVAVDARQRPESMAIVKDELQRISLEHGQRLYANPTAHPKMVVLSQVSQLPPPPPPADWTQSPPTLQQAQMQLGIPALPAPVSSQKGISRRAVIGMATVSILGATFLGTSFLASRSNPGFSKSGSSPGSPPHNQFSFMQRYSYIKHSKGITAVTWSPNGQRIVSASEDDTIQVWDALSGTHVVVYTEHKATVNAVTWSPNGKYIASASMDGIQVWNSATGKRLPGYSQSAKPPYFSIVWSPDGKQIAAGSQAVEIWDVVTGTMTKSFLRTSGVTGLAWSPDSTSLANSNQHGDILFIAVKGDNTENMLPHIPYIGDISTFAWSPDGRFLAVAAKVQNQYIIRVLDINTNHTIQEHRHNAEIQAVAWSANSMLIASGGKDREVHVWSPFGEGSFTYTGHTDTVRTIAWAPQNNLLATAGDDRIVQVWYVGTSQEQ